MLSRRFEKECRAIRIQATALMTMAEKATLEGLAAEHKVSLSVILRASVHGFKGNPESQQAWIESANQEFRREFGDTK